MLCHSHDDKLWKQTSFGVRGALEQDARLAVPPSKLIPGISPDLPSLARFCMNCRRNAQAYLEKRNLPRPSIPWDDIIAVKRAALGK